MLTIIYKGSDKDREFINNVRRLKATRNFVIEEGKECIPKQKEKFWENEITILMRDFRFPPATIKRIIEETRKTKTNKDTNAIMYDRAWRKFRTLITT